MSHAATATATKTKEKLNGDEPPKPPPLVLSSADFEAASQMCEHEWMSHTSGMSEVGKLEGQGGEGEGECKDSDSVAKKNRFGDDDDDSMVAAPPPKPPVAAAAAAPAVVAPSSTLSSAATDASASREANGASRAAPRGPGQRQFGGEGERAIGNRAGQSSSPSPLPSTPSISDNDEEEDLDLVPERGTFRSRRDTMSRFPMTSPAISDGGGLRDEHVEDPWSESDDSDDDSASVSGGGGAEGDNERSASGNGSGGGGTPLAALRRRSRRLDGGGGTAAVRRTLLPSPALRGNSGGGGADDDDRSLHPSHNHRPLRPKRKKKEEKNNKNKKKKKLERARSLRSPGRHFTVVTTASLPWMTGTSVNPTLRSAYLARALPRSSVTLMLPWLPASQQPCVYPKGVSFETPERQEKHVRDWIRQRTGFDPPGLRITWYHARYCPVMKSIFPYGDLTRLVGGEGGEEKNSSPSPSPCPSSLFSKRDVAILEEPEHLTWFHSGPRWTKAFTRAIGIAHTNYGDYVAALRGKAAGAAVAAANRALVAVHTDAVIRLSDALPALPRARTAFVHGVARGFITAGRGAEPGRGAYFVGKALWAKGYSELVALLRPDPEWGPAAAAARDPPRPSPPLAEQWGPPDGGAEDLPGTGGSGGGSGGSTPPPPPSVDAFGSGEDADAIREAVAAAGVPLTLRPGRDHLDPSLRAYRVFVNPSTSDVVATTSAEALALGRWLVCPIHPCNDFFSSFRACLRYRDAAGFRAQLCRALSRPPPKLSAEERARLTWSAATRRFLDAVEAPAERQRAQNARRKGIFLSASTASLAGGSSVAGGSSDDNGRGDESDDEERRFPPPPTALRNPPPPTVAPPASPSPPPPSSTSKLARVSNSARGAAAAFAESLTHRLYGFAMRVEATRRLFGAGAFTRVAPALPCGPNDHALEARRPCHEREHELQGYRRSRYVGGRG